MDAFEEYEGRLITIYVLAAEPLHPTRVHLGAPVSALPSGRVLVQMRKYALGPARVRRSQRLLRPSDHQWPVMSVCPACMHAGTRATRAYIEVGGIDCNGSDIPGTYRAGVDAAACRARCNELPSCVAYVFKPSGGECYVKNGLGTRVADTAISCYVRASAGEL